MWRTVVAIMAATTAMSAAEAARRACCCMGDPSWSQDLQPRTVELYRSLLRCHLLPEFGEVPLGRILPSAVRSWNAALARRYPVTAAKAYRLLNTMLTSAVADELIVRNPCVVKGASQERSPERPMLSIAEVDAIVEAIPEPWRIAVELAAWCHLRLGEVLGLERRDVDLLRRRIHIERTSDEVGGIYCGSVLRRPRPGVES